MFQLPPTTTAPPSFGTAIPQQQPTQAQVVAAGQDAQGLQPQPGIAQPVQQQPPPPAAYPNLNNAMRTMPNPGFNYANQGLATNIGPQLRGMPGMVKAPPLMGPQPNGALSQGTRMPSLVR